MDAAHNPGSTRRTAPRFPASLPCIIAWDEGSAEATLLDLSLTGAAAVVAEVAAEMRKSVLTLVLETAAEPIEVAVRVVRVEKEPLGGGYLLRLRFDKLDLPQAKVLARIVTELGTEFRDRQAALATDRLGRPRPSRFPQYPPRDRQR